MTARPHLRIALLIAFFLVISIGGVVLWSVEVPRSEVESVAEVLPPRLSFGDQPSSAPQGEFISIVSADTPGGAVAKSAIAALYSGVPRSRYGLTLEDDPFGARSLEEQRWLDRNGYPNAAEWKALNAASLYQLRDAANGGDPMAAVMVDFWDVFLSGSEDAVNSLLRRGAGGNLFALEMLAIALEGARVNNDPVFASAVRELVRLRGNHAFGMIPDGNLSTPLDPLQRLEAGRRARELYQFLDRIRQAELGLPPAAPDPRPVRP